MGVLNKVELIAGGLGDAMSDLGNPLARPTLPALRLQGMRLITDDAAGLADAENYLGTQIGFITAFAETNNAAGTWADSLAATRAQITALAPLNRPLYWGFPLCHGTAGNGAAETLRGDFDTTIRTMFQEIVAANRPLPGNYFLIRLGWEMNFWSAYPWCRAFITPAQYIALYRKIVMLARSVDSRLFFDWTPNIRVIGADGKVIDPTQFWPGASWVDVNGTDAYLRYEIETANGITPTQTIANVWEGEWGINQLYAFAEAQGKPFLIAETGINGDGTANNGTTGDLYSAHINRLYEFVRSKSVFLHGYWNKASPFNCRLSNNQYAAASAAYKAAFDKVAKPWTPARQFGRELLEHRDASNTASMVMDAGTLLVTSWADQVAGKLAQNTQSARPTYSATARNGLPGVTGDGADDVLIQTDVTNVPATGKAHTTFMQAYTLATAANFTYFLADTDATGGGTQTRAIGHNGGNLRIQSGNAGYAGPAIRPIDASIVVGFRDAYTSPSAAFTVQGSVNGGAPWSDNVTLPNPTMTITKRVLFGNGASTDGVSQRINATLQEQGTVSRVLSLAETQMLHGYLAWKWGNQAALPANHPNKAAAPMYGGIL